MKPIVLIHGYSAESKETSKAAIREIYHTLPQDLRAMPGGARVVEIDLSRWLSLEDGITVDDLSFGLERALNSKEFGHLRASGFQVIIHSTGALIIRNWVRKYTQVKSCPVERILYLAGANLGSGWAHIGKAQLAKYGFEVFKRAEVGERILTALEFGSDWTLDMHLHFTRKGSQMLPDYGVQEFCIIGSQAKEGWFPIPVRYAKEDGADGVVRVSGCNLNINYVRIEAKDTGRNIDWQHLVREVAKDRKFDLRSKANEYYQFAETWQACASPETCVAFAVPYNCSHSGDETGVVAGKENRTQVLKLVEAALSNRSWAKKLEVFDQETKETYKKAAKRSVDKFWRRWIQQPSAQYDPHAQVIIRLRDQYGAPVLHYDIYFESVKSKSDKSLPLNALMEHKHINHVDKNIICFYMRTEAYNKDRADVGEPYPWDDRLTDVDGCWLEISASEPETEDIQYLPLRIEFDRDQLKRWIRSHETTVIDVVLQRHPSGGVFHIVKD